MVKFNFIRDNRNEFGKHTEKDKLVQKHLQQIKSILEQRKETRSEDNSGVDKTNPLSSKEKKDDIANATPFTSNKIVPIVLEENEINR